MEQTIKPGDFVRLTDHISNGEVVRIENVDEHGFASWISDDVSVIFNSTHSIYADTYEQAVEAVLKYCLTNLID